MTWLSFNYMPVSLFRLRPSKTTDSGVQSSLIPTFFAVRTAFLAQAFLVGGEPCAREAFEVLKKAEIKLSPPNKATVNTLAWRGIRWSDRSNEEKISLGGFGYREYIAYKGFFRVAISTGNLEPKELSLIKKLGSLVYYFGKNNSFFQFMSVKKTDKLDRGFGKGWSMEETVGGVLAELDDWGKNITYEMVDINYDNVPKFGRDRVIVPIVLPYKLVYGPGGITYYTWGGECEDAL